MAESNERENNQFKALFSTPDSLKKLAEKILNVSENDNVLDIDSEDVFNSDETVKFDKILANAMFLMMERTVRPRDWQLHLKMMNMLSQNGRAVSIVRLGCLESLPERSNRHYFIDNGYIESVIYLPPRLLSGTAISLALIVFSHNNDSVRMVDAQHLFETDRRQNLLSDNNITEICRMLSEQGEYSTAVSLDTLRKNDANLNPLRYLYCPPIENGVPFGSVIKNITRGIQFKANEHTKYLTQENTGIKYIILSNINNGIIDINQDIQYLCDSVESEKYLIPQQSLLLSKIGSVGYKSAVFDLSENEKAVANCNLYIIQIDQTKANPYYIQAFLESELGQQSLRYIQSGTAIKTISMEDLRKMLIPLPPIEEQNRIAARYQTLTNEYRLLCEKAQKCLEEKVRLL